jgi:outer membrane protein insertion porin family
MRNKILLPALILSLAWSGGYAQTAADVNVKDAPVVLVEDPLNTDPVARLSARLAYSSDSGVVAGVGFGTDRLFGHDQTLRFDAELQEEGSRYSFRYGNDAIFGTSPTFGLQVLRAESRAGSTYDFDTAIMRIEPRLTWEVSPALRVEGFLSYSMNDIENVSATGSLLIRADEGDQEAGTIGLDAEYRFPLEPGGALRLARLSLRTEIGSTSRDHEFVRFTASAQTVHAFRDGDVLLRSSLRFGALDTQSGTSSIGDRFMLGQALIRGFEFGGFGPRDLGVRGQPALGGNSYGIGRFDIQFPNAINSGEGRLTPGVFMDVGILWGLDDVAGGPTGTNIVDDSGLIRASLGLSLRIDTGIGPIQLYVAHPIAQKDYDRTQIFGLSLSHSF